MNITTTLNLCGVDFNLHDGSIGCSISGGADSALTAYILLTNITTPIKFYTTDSVLWPNRVEACRRVYKYLTNITGRTDCTLKETAIQEEHSLANLFVTPKKDLESGKLDVLYTGLTHNPPVDLGYSQSAMSVRDGDEYKDPYIRQIYMPFRNHDKSKVAEIYKELNLLDTLFPETLSCTRTTNSTHCGDCWWCRERLWAFNRIL